MSKKVDKKRPARAPDLAKQRFGRFRVLSRAPNIPGRRDARWHCLCDCGAEKDVFGFSLKDGSIESCGCLNKELVTQRATKHGQHKSKLYKVWTAMIQRCTNSNDPAFPNYGGRGITVAPEFLESFAAFAEAIGPKPTPAHTVDRIDNSQGYYPGNLQWRTRAEQLRNKRTNHNITFNDKTQCREDWASELGIDTNTLAWRLRNWPLDRALTEPSHRH